MISEWKIFAKMCGASDEWVCNQSFRSREAAQEYGRKYVENTAHVFEWWVELIETEDE